MSKKKKKSTDMFHQAQILQHAQTLQHVQYLQDYLEKQKKKKLKCTLMNK